MSSDPIVTLQASERPTWSLDRAVLVYTPGARTLSAVEFAQDHMADAPGRAYATVHKVLHGKGGPKLDAGVPATREACADLAMALGANAALGGFIPPNLLYLGARSIIWWRPPGPARVFFDTTKAVAGDQLNDKKGAALLGRVNGNVYQPGLVFAVCGREWYVYAVLGKERPHAGAALHRAPYFNVWASGRICTGSVRLPETLSAQGLGVYEKAFFDSEFTHPNLNGKGKLINHWDGPYAFWRGLLKRPHDLGFPENNLVHLKCTLQRLAASLEKNGKAPTND